MLNMLYFQLHFPKIN